MVAKSKLSSLVIVTFLLWALIWIILCNFILTGRNVDDYSSFESDNAEKGYLYNFDDDVRSKTLSVTDDTRVNAAPEPIRLLPSFQGQKVGGFLLFYHVAKTGGTTIRTLFERMANERPDDFMSRRITLYNFSIDKKPMQKGDSCPPINHKAKHRIKNLLSTIESMMESKEPDRTMLMEIHGGEYGLKAMTEHINEWRKLSKMKNRPFFVFTLVRDPVEFSLSYFNYFHYNCSMSFCNDIYENATEENLLKATNSHPNLQCFFLLHDMHASFYNRCRPTETECNNVYEDMKQSLDWIGTTENISHDTMPLLTHMLEGAVKRPHNENEHKANTSIKGILKKLDERTVNSLKSSNELDLKIYHRVKEDFQLNKLYANELQGL